MASQNSLPPTTSRLVSRSRSNLALAAAWLIALAGVGLLAASPAGAFISGEFGLQQRRQTWNRYAPLQYHGGPVIHASDTYAIYWDPLELYNSEWMRIIDGYFRNVGESSGSQGDVFALNAQYGETGYRTGPGASSAAKEDHAANQTTFRGAYTDTDSYPSSGDCTEAAAIVCLTDQQIKAELQKVIASGALPGATGTVPGAKSTPVYYILTPPGVTVCTSGSSPSTCSNSTTQEREAAEIDEGEVLHSAETGICGYHSTINAHGADPIVYAVQPWIAGDAGLFVESESPLTTSGPTADVLACQDDESLEEPNQIDELNPFVAYGAGLADVIVNDLAYEQSDIVVDPLFNGWYQNAPTEEHGYPEQADMCKFAFQGATTSAATTPTHAGTASDESIGTGSYYTNWAFNSSGYVTGKEPTGCWQGVDLAPHITAPNPVKTGDVVGLDANESGITLAAAPLNVRPQKEETRMSDELVIIADQKVELAKDITELEEREAKLTAKIAELELNRAHEETEILQLTKEEQRVKNGEATLARERKEAEEAGLTKTEEEEFTKTENRLSTERQRITTAKTTDEATKKSDEEGVIAAERELRAASERKVVIEDDKHIVEGDKGLAEEEKKLADEHRLIGEREPLIAPIYKWDFGYQEDGKEVTEEGEEKASVFHTFPCAGTYDVSLTVIDGGGFEQGLSEAVDKTITVEGKSCEAPSGGESGGSSGSGSSGSSSTTTPSATAGSSSGTPSAGAAKPQVPAPVAAQAIVSSSLAKTVKKGLVVRYSVNEQVAGSFNVLLAASIAKRLGLRLPSAKGLPAGTPPQEVVGKALLITTKGGHGTIKIEFGKVTGGRIGKLGKVSLMLQLNLRNAAGQTTTVLSKITLH